MREGLVQVSVSKEAAPIPELRFCSPALNLLPEPFPFLSGVLSQWGEGMMLRTSGVG
jgi:hypothetical protein